MGDTKKPEKTEEAIRMKQNLLEQMEKIKKNENVTGQEKEQTQNPENCVIL